MSFSVFLILNIVYASLVIPYLYIRTNFLFPHYSIEFNTLYQYNNSIEHRDTFTKQTEGYIMKNSSRRILVLAMVLAMVMSVFAPLSAFAGSVLPTKITIFHTNDMHGTYDFAKNKSVGFPRIAAYRSSTPNSLLVDAGDFSQGQPIASVTKGQAMLNMMVAAKYDAIAVGNHEFDYTAADLKAMDDTLNKAKIPFLTSVGGTGDDFGFLGLSPAKTDAGLGNYTIKDVGGVKVGIFGVTTPDTLVTGSPTKLANVDFKVNTAKNKAFDKYITSTISSLKAEGCTVIIALSHSGNDSVGSYTEYSSNYIANIGNGDIDLIVDGHAHNSLMGANSIVDPSGTRIVSAGSNMKNLGKVELTLDNGNVSSSTSTDVAPNAGDAEDAATKDAVKTVVDTLEPLFSETIGYTYHNLYGGTATNKMPAPDNIGVAIARRVQTNLGSLICDARLWQAKEYLGKTFPQYKDLPTVVFQVGGGVRETIEAGPVTMRDVLAVMPFGSREYYVLVTPKDIYGVLENGVSALTDQDIASGALSANGSIHGRFPQVGGMSFTFTMNNNPGDARVTQVKLADGTILDRADETTKIVLCTTEYEVGGGDGYQVLMGKKQFDDNNPNSDAFAQYVKTKLNGVIDLPADYGSDRITMINKTGVPDSAEYKLLIKNNGVAVTSGKYTVNVNGDIKHDMVPDANGYIYLTLDGDKSYSVSVTSPEGHISKEGILDRRAGLSSYMFDEDFSKATKIGIMKGTPEATLSDDIVIKDFSGAPVSTPNVQFVIKDTPVGDNIISHKLDQLPKLNGKTLKYFLLSLEDEYGNPLEITGGSASVRIPAPKGLDPSEPVIIGHWVNGKLVEEKCTVADGYIIINDLKSVSPFVMGYSIKTAAPVVPVPPTGDMTAVYIAFSLVASVSLAASVRKIRK